jgi:excisionase family DNA binding protein
MVQKLLAAMMKSHTLHSVRAHLSPAQAAQAVSVSRWTIMRAIKTHELKAVRDNKNHWKIDSDELDRWSATTVRTVVAAHPVHTPKDSPETLAHVAALEAENSQLRERISEIKEDRDAWREMAQRRRWWQWK